MLPIQNFTTLLTGVITALAVADCLGLHFGYGSGWWFSQKSITCYHFDPKNFFFLLNNNYTIDKQNMETIINIWNTQKKRKKEKQDKKLQLLTIYCNKEDKAKDN